MWLTPCLLFRHTVKYFKRDFWHKHGDAPADAILPLIPKTRPMKKTGIAGIDTDFQRAAEILDAIRTICLTIGNSIEEFKSVFQEAVDGCSTLDIRSMATAKLNDVKNRALTMAEEHKMQALSTVEGYRTQALAVADSQRKLAEAYMDRTVSMAEGYKMQAIDMADAQKHQVISMAGDMRSQAAGMAGQMRGRAEGMVDAQKQQVISMVVTPSSIFSGSRFAQTISK